MTAEKKARELIDKFKQWDYDWIATGNEYCIIQYAIISVNEILSLQKMKNNAFWKDVKIELEKKLKQD